MADKFVTTKSLSDEEPPPNPPGKLSDANWDEWDDTAPLAEELSDPAPDGPNYEPEPKLVSVVRTYHIEDSTVAKAREFIEQWIEAGVTDEVIKDCNVYPGGLIQVITT